MLRWNRSLIVICLALWPLAAQADILSSPNFRVDTDAATTFGGFGSSTSYRLTDAGGEAAVGAGTSGSYKLTSGYVATLAQNIQLNVQPNGLAAYYPLDTGSGTAAYDVSAYNNQGAFSNTPGWVTGKIGQALSFNGSTQTVAVPSAATFNNNYITVEAWIKSNVTTAGLSSVSRIDNDATPANGAWNLGHGSSASTYRFQVRVAGTTYSAESGTGFTTTGFQHLVGTYDGSNVRLYLNGTQTAVTSISGTLSSMSTNIVVGGRTTATNYFNGNIDEIKIFSKAMTSDEVAAEYSAQNAGTASGVAIPAVTPGSSQIALLDAIVRTDAAGYDLGIQQDHNLLHTDTTTTISPVSGSIAAPNVWSEGTTQGLGFTLFSLTGSGNTSEGTWTGGTKFAAIPGSGTTFHSRTGFTGGLPERNTVQLRLDVPTSQKSGAYNNTLTYTATLKP